MEAALGNRGNMQGIWEVAFEVTRSWGNWFLWEDVIGLFE